MENAMKIINSEVYQTGGPNLTGEKYNSYYVKVNFIDVNGKEKTVQDKIIIE